MSKLRIYSSDSEPATRWCWNNPIREKGQWRRYIVNKPRRLVRAWCCNKLRWAQNCVVQVYYDQVPHWCRAGKGCKKP